MSAVVYLPRPMLSPALRKRCEQTIERLIALLDATDTPDADAEPMLGAAEYTPQSSCNWLRSLPDADERESDNERELQNEDGGDINDVPQDDNELDGSVFDDMEPGDNVEAISKVTACERWAT